MLIASALLLASAASAAPPAPATVSDQNATIIRQEQEVNPDSYRYAFETDNNIRTQESGDLKRIVDAEQKETEAISAQGGFSYVAPDGQTISVVYVADENGFQPQGDHIPQPPPIPHYIERALRYLAEHPPKEEAKN